MAQGGGLLQVTKTVDGYPLENSVPLVAANNAHDFYDLGDAPETTTSEETGLNDDDFLISNPCLYAYNFTTKAWCE